MFRGTFGDKPIFSSSHEAVNLAKLRKPVPPNFDRATTFTNTLGREPARGWLIMLRRDLDAMIEAGTLNALNELIFQFEEEDGTLYTRKLYDILIAQEPICLTPSHTATDPDAAYLVEVADRRHLVNSRILSVATWNNYDSTNTWTEVISGLWAVVGTHLGQPVVPTLPVTPPGTPINVNFSGENAWVELNRVLAFLGLAIAYNPLLPRTSQYTIVQVGAADTDTDTAITDLEDAGYKIHDAEFIDAVIGRVPAGVRVYFPQHPERMARDPVYVDVANDEPTGTQDNLYVPLFDNTFAIHDTDGTVQNQTALNTQAEARADDYFRMLKDGGRRYWKRFSGLWAIMPSSQIKSVTWSHQENVPQGGVFTDIFRNPYLLPDDVGFIRKPTPPRTGYAPVRLVVLQAQAYTRSGNTITFTVNGSQTIDGSATVVGDRVLLNRGDACTGHADNGIWQVTTAGTVSVKEVWRRTLDADNSDDVRTGLSVEVAGGSAWKGSRWRVWTDDPITLNTTAIWFAPTRFKAKLTTRESVPCGSSGSGGTSHSQWQYGFVGIKRIVDGDGCPANVDTEFGPDITGTAEEWNNREVPTGTIVDIETVFREDLSASGSGDGIASGSGCVFMFSAPGNGSETAVCLKKSFSIQPTLNLSDGDLFKELWITTFDQDDEGCWQLFPAELLYQFDMACRPCDVGGNPSGSGSTECVACQGCQAAYCVTFDVTDPIANGLCEAISGRGITLNLVNCNTNNNSTWSGETRFVFTATGETIALTASLVRLCVCDGTYAWYIRGGVSIYDNAGRPIGGWPWIHKANDAGGWLSLGTSSDPDTPPTLTGQTEAPSGCAGCCWERGGEHSTESTFTVAVGACPADSGSGTSCPCTWQADITGAFTTLLAGDAGLCSAPTAGSPNEIRNTNYDGSTCTGDETSVICGNCNTADRTAAISGQTGFLAGVQSSVDLARDAGGQNLWITDSNNYLTGIACGTGPFSLYYWCENGWLYCAVAGASGGGDAIPADAGSTCDDATFTLIYNTDNTICPGQTGSITVHVTL